MRPFLPLLLLLAGMLLLPLIVQADSTAWVVGHLSTSRAQQTATLLTNGKVLIAGGSSGSTELATAEIYDPATGLFTATGNLSTPRVNHTATLLPDGWVLVSGGQSNGQTLASAEIYDPTTGHWTPTGSLHTARAFHTATPLRNGLILVIGGTGLAASGTPAVAPTGGALFSGELYDPTTGQWTLTASLHVARYAHTATLLPDGQVIVAGGLDASGSLTPTATSEVYNATKKTWTTVGALHTASFAHAAVLLPAGQVLLAGGGSPPPLTRAELYDPTTRKWIATGSLATAQGLPILTLRPTGQVLLTGSATTESYDPVTGLWVPGANLSTTRLGQTASLLISGDILLVGGRFGLGGQTLASAEVYQNIHGFSTLTTPLARTRDYCTKTLLPNGKLLLASGSNVAPTSKTAVLYDPTAGVWTSTGNLPEPIGLQCANLLPNGKVMLTGGGYNYVTKNCSLYDPASGTWTVAPPMFSPRLDFGSVLLADGRLMVIGGTGLGTGSECEIFDPTAGAWSKAATLPGKGYYRCILLANGDVFAIAWDTKITATYLYHPATGTWTQSASLSAARRRYATVLLPDGRVMISGGIGGNSPLGLAIVEFYNPTTGSWSSGAKMSTTRTSPSACVLTDGKVLVAGGDDSLTRIDNSTADIYDPATNIWTPMGSIFPTTPLTSSHLLADGRVLLCDDETKTVQIFNPGLVSAPVAQPSLDPFSSLNPAAKSHLTGTGLTGLWDSAAGADVPVVRLQGLSNGQTLTLPLDPSEGFDKDFFAYLAPGSLFSGYVRATLFVGGVPSLSRFISSSALLPQTLQFTPVGDKSYGDAPFTLSATASSGLPVNFLVISGPANVSGSVVTINGTGLVVLQAAQSGNGTFAPVYAEQSVVVAREAQTLDFTPVPEPLYVGNTVTLSATASSGLPATFRVVSGPASISAGVVTFNGAGDVTLQCDQAGDATFLPAPSVVQTLTVVNKLTQTVRLVAFADRQLSAGPVVAKATASSGLPVTFSVAGPATIAGNLVTPTGGGLVTVTASQAGNDTYLPAPSASRTFKVFASQTISLASIPAQITGASLVPVATASSGLPVVFSIVSGPAKVVGGAVFVTGSGVVTLAADQPGDAYTTAAPQVTTSFTVGPAPQIITFPAVASQAFNGPPIVLQATSSSGLVVSYSVAGPATLSQNTLTLTGVGVVKVKALQAGTVDYLPATPVTINISSQKATQTVTFDPVPVQTVGAPPVTLSATASTGLPVTYSLVSGPGTLSGNVLTVTGKGNILVKAVQSGNTNYQTASASLRVNVK